MPHIADEPSVAVIRGPADADARHQLAHARAPRLLLLAEGDVPPADLDELEDWVRTPFTTVDLATRAETLRRRAIENPPAPVLDEDGLLRHQGRWVAIPDSQVPMVRLLLSRFGSLVRTDELAEAYAAGGGTTTGRSVNMVVARLRGRIADLGLHVHVVRRRGVILDVSGATLV